MKQSFHQAFRALKMANADTPIVFDEDLTLELFIEEVSQETKEVSLIERLSRFSPTLS